MSIPQTFPIAPTSGGLGKPHVGKNIFLGKDPPSKKNTTPRVRPLPSTGRCSRRVLFSTLAAVQAQRRPQQLPEARVAPGAEMQRVPGVEGEVRGEARVLALPEPQLQPAGRFRGARDSGTCFLLCWAWKLEPPLQT